MVKGVLSRPQITDHGGRITMPLYEYRCGRCEKQFDVTQSVHARAEDTICPFCQAQEATRLLSSFISTIKGDHKPGFKEMNAYNMLLSLIHISEPTRQAEISYAVFCLK